MKFKMNIVVVVLLMLMIESSFCYSKKTHFRKITKTRNHDSLKLNNYIFSTIAILILLLTISSIIGLIYYIFSTIINKPEGYKQQEEDIENIIDILNLKHLLKLQLSKSITPYNIV